MLLEGLQQEPSVSIRVNPARLPADATPEGADGRVPWCHEGFYLKQRPAFTADPLLHAGAYYVQEASSMFLAHTLRTILLPSFVSHPPTTALDLCAAPGGKSTLLRSLLPDDCLLVANEPIRARAQVLAENMAKWGHPNVVVTQATASDFAKLTKKAGRFDLILADVPCSGEGMMRKEEEAVRQWSPAFVAECAALQRSIVQDIWPALRPGGMFIYSTCTFNPEEDEDNVEWIARELEADVVPIPVEPTWGILGDLRRERKTSSDRLPCCHFLPGRVRGEGFFIAALRKHGETTEQECIAPHKEGKNKKGKGRKNPPLTFADHLHESINTLPTDQLDATGLPSINIPLEQAIRYLQREAIVLPPEAPLGCVQVCYCGQRLGMVKNLGARANNLYPREWRIRSSFVEPHCIFPALKTTCEEPAINT